jgi:hypothetical protein
MALTTEPPKPSSSFGLPLIVVLVVASIGAYLFWYLSRETPPPKGPQLTQEARAYIRDGGLKLSDVEMKAAKSYMNQMLVEITGNITNAGGRNLKQVDIHCVFYDPYGQVVLRELSSIVKAKSGGLKAGETKPFRLAFDTLPESWNHQMPQLVIAQILFEP